MDPLTAYSRLGAATFLDVREGYEWDGGHIEGSLHIPISQILFRTEELEKDREVIVVCQVGQRSALVTDFLYKNGYDAHNLDGGLARWTAESLPLVGREARVVDGWARDINGRRLDGFPD